MSVAVINKDDLSLRIFLFGTFFSLVVHTFLVFLAVSKPIFLTSVQLPEKSIAVDISGLLPVVDSLQEAAKDAPEDARFASDRNLRTDKETSPDRARSNVPRAGGGAEGKAAETSSGRTVYSLSQSDILKDKSFKRETLKAGPKGEASTGFQERLSRGVELKLNARAFDYGSYINRVRTKLSQRWSPQKTIQTSMYSQRQVRVDIAVVLNSDGEIVELFTQNSSRYPGFDEEAIRALRDGAPYPNPPKSLIQDDGLIYLPWAFVLTMEQWGVAKGVE